MVRRKPAQLGRRSRRIRTGAERRTGTRSRSRRFDVLGQKREVCVADIAVLVPFTRQLAATISAGIPLMQALTMVGAERSNRSLRGVVSDLTKQVQEGSSFAEALGRHHPTFPTLYVDVVAAGEASGHLDTMLTSLAAMLEKRQATGR